MKKLQYMQPCTAVVPVQTTSSLLVGSGNSLPKGGGENQTEAW